MSALFLFTHDLALARHFCDRLVVMKNGDIIEQGDSDEIVFNPRNEYTKELITAAQEPDILLKTADAMV